MTLLIWIGEAGMSLLDFEVYGEGTMVSVPIAKMPSEHRAALMELDDYMVTATQEGRIWLIRRG